MMGIKTFYNATTAKNINRAPGFVSLIYIETEVSMPFWLAICEGNSFGFLMSKIFYNTIIVKNMKGIQYFFLYLYKKGSVNILQVINLGSKLHVAFQEKMRDNLLCPLLHLKVKEESDYILFTKSPNFYKVKQLLIKSS